MGESSTLISLIETALASFLAGGGILKGIDYMQKRNSDTKSKKGSKSARDISELSFAFRENLKANVERLEAEAKGYEAEIINLNREVAKLTAELKALENKLLMIKYDETR